MGKVYINNHNKENSDDESQLDPYLGAVCKIHASAPTNPNVFVGKYQLGQKVYLVTDREQEQYIVTAVTFCLSGAALYSLACGCCEVEVSASEISTEKQLLE